MTVFLTGATGFVGRYVLRALLEQGHTVRCLVRPESEHKLEVQDTRITVVRGNLLQRPSLRDVLIDCRAVVHLVGIIEEHPRQGITFERVHVEATRHLVEEARAAGVPCFVHMSANGAHPDGVSRYQVTKWQAEAIVRQAGFTQWTIFRPSFIFGDPGKGHPDIVVQLARTLVRPFPVLPILGDGTYTSQPIFVGEVAEAFARAIEMPEAHGQVFCAAGPDRLSFNDIVDTISLALLERTKPKIHIPLPLARLLVQTMGRVGLLPVTPDQFAMLIEGNTCDERPFYQTFGVQPLRFRPEHLQYVKKYVS